MIETDPQPPEAPGNPPAEKAHPEEVRFLAGPQSRLAEFFRILRIAWEFFRGFRTLHFVGPCVTVFGSARVDGDDRYYALAREMGAELAHSGFTVITGGGPGVMEAANRGAKEAGGRSVGVNIVLPHEQVTNKYLDVVLTFRYFFVRKVTLVKYSYAFIAMPGGYGTFRGARRRGARRARATLAARDADRRRVGDDLALPRTATVARAGRRVGRRARRSCGRGKRRLRAR